MIVSYFRAGSKHHVDGAPWGEPCISPRIRSTGSAQRQLLLDFEEDQVFVVRQVARYGTIEGRRIFPNTDEGLRLVPQEEEEANGCA